MKCHAFGKTDVGRTRSQNEDYFLLDQELGLFLVCDGMGGHAAGEVASELTAQTIASELRKEIATVRRYAISPETDMRARVRSLLREVVQRASRVVWESSGAPEDPDSDKGMGTTLSMMLVCGRYAFVVHVGDSRVYLIRNGQMHQLTEDHSLVSEMLRQGILSKNNAESYPFANFVTRAVGIQPEVEPDILHIELMDGDTYLLCSDGLTKHAGPNDLLAAIQSNEIDQLPDVLVFMANEAGGQDNITAVVVGVGDESSTTQTLRHSDLVAKKLETLGRIPMFSSFEYKDLAKLLEIIEMRTVRPYDIMIREGEMGADMYIVLSGRADVYKQEQHINELAPGDFFGELSLIDDVVRSATVIARDAMTLLVIQRKRLFELLEKNDKMAAKMYWAFLRRMSLQIRNKDDELYQLRRLLDSTTGRNPGWRG
ncbi:MAG TPA: cyclic nucleotide-binding domain-containing protein [Haliangium sp.]|nr:cyclic nucleotide-binding domain-containing protein [Haliangium sp.]